MKLAKPVFLLLFFLNVGIAAEKPIEWPFIKLAAKHLTQVYPTVTVKISDDPVYQKAQTYQAIALNPLIRSLAKHYPGSLEQASVIFMALDGYQAVMPYTTVINNTGFLAFKDLSAQPQNWHPFRFGQEMITPAPFYLVWPAMKRQDKWRFAWPFQLASIQLKPNQLVFKRAAPTSQNKVIQEGFSLFSRFCIRCHAINGAGGQVGPDLNTPVNPTALYSQAILIQRILNAKKFNPTSKMPLFEPLLSKAQTEKIIRYLEAIADATP
jgi:mono/diheme cytochrome c family protein